MDREGLGPSQHDNLDDLGESGAELSGLAYFEVNYSSPEDLAFNVAMATREALNYTEDVLLIGKDLTIAGQNSQDFLIEVLRAMAEPEGRKAGYTLLMTSLAETAKTPPEHYQSYLQELAQALEEHTTHYDAMTFEEKYIQKKKENSDNLRPFIRSLEFQLECFMNLYFEEILESPLDQRVRVDDALYIDFIRPTRIKDMFDSSVRGNRKCGLSLQVIFRLREQARALELPGAEELSLQ